MAKRVKEIFEEIIEHYECVIDTSEVMDDHVNLFLEVPPKHAPVEAVQMIKAYRQKCCSENLLR
jgi:REP element-mobilizing transposase RayT